MTDYRRQTALFNPADHAERHVTIVGLGNIGSHTAQAMARMGIKNFTLYDFDDVEAHNLASQAYTVADLETPKTTATEAEIKRLQPDANVKIETVAFTGKENVPDILVIAVDSMVARQEIQEMLVVSGQNPFVIDGRMGGGQVEVRAMSCTEWGDTFSANPDTDECSARYISYTSYVIAGMMTNTLKRVLQGERYTTRIIMHVDTYDIITEWYASDE